jgi:hypothetical protein
VTQNCTYKWKNKKYNNVRKVPQFQSIIGISMRTNCVPIAAELFLYSYEDGLTQKLTTDKVIQKLRPLISLS